MQQRFLSGAMAAQVIGMSYKTLKDRYDTGWINGDRTDKGKLKFTPDEVERARKAWEEERSLFITSPQDLNLPSDDLEVRIVELEEELDLLKARIAKLEGNPLSEGCVLVSEFAERNGISRSTFHDHIVKKWLTPEQQEKALDYWYRYGVIHEG